jgi:DNA-binding response OmpR family regulator
MDEYLTKPLRVDDLRAVIDRLLARRRTTCAAPDVRADGQRDVA